MELTPDFSITINGQEGFPKDRVISIQTTDEAGIISDSCEIELDDYDNALKFPNTEAKIVLHLGYKETGLDKIGTYFVKEISLNGARRIVKIHGNAAPKAMRSQKTQSNEGTISKFISKAAESLGFKPKTSEAIKEIELEDNPQIAESNMSYVTRLVNKIGAIVKPTDEKIVMTESKSGKSASGKSLPVKYIEAKDVASYDCTFRETETKGAVGTVFACWYDRKTGKYQLEKAGSGDPETEIKEVFATKEQAASAAKARLKQTEKSNKTMRFTIEGRTDLFAESPLVLKGFSEKVPIKWTIQRVNHSLSANGFTTNLECCGSI